MRQPKRCRSTSSPMAPPQSWAPAPPRSWASAPPIPNLDRMQLVEMFGPALAGKPSSWSRYNQPSSCYGELPPHRPGMRRNNQPAQELPAAPPWSWARRGERACPRPPRLGGERARPESAGGLGPSTSRPESAGLASATEIENVQNWASFARDDLLASRLIGYSYVRDDEA